MPEEIKLTVTEAPKSYASRGFKAAVKNEETGNILALFESDQEAKEYRYWKSQTADQRLESALCVVRQDYNQDVRDTAESVKSELEDRLKDQESGEDLREWLMEHIHETIDGSSRVIYTQSAMLGVFASDNDGAYFEDFGDEGIAEDGAINWSRLCYSAFERDVIEQLEAIGIDVNSPVPACADCGSEDQDERYLIDGDFVCDLCKDAREEDSAEDEDEDQEDQDEDQETGKE
jgi:hypothetical protein